MITTSLLNEQVRAAIENPCSTENTVSRMKLVGKDRRVEEQQVRIKSGIVAKRMAPRA